LKQSYNAPVPFAFRPSSEALTVGDRRDRIALATAVGDRFLIGMVLEAI